MRGVSSTSTNTVIQFTRQMVPTDASAIARVVGFSEYGNALNHFDRLASRLDDAELKAVDEIISERDEYAIFTNLAGDGPQESDSDDTSLTGGNERRGLAWVMALARLEFGAMLATFSNTPTPFQSVQPTALESDAYLELLIDGARAHYQALASDPFLRQVARMSAAQPAVLAYSRRLVLARAMLTAAMQLGGDRYSGAEWQQLATAKNDLDQLQAGMTLKIQLYLRGTAVTSIKSKTTRDYTEACGALLRAEQRETAAGTARVERIRE